MSELIGFLTPTTRLDVRRGALEYIVGVSGALDGSAGRLFIARDFELGKVCFSCFSKLFQALSTLCESSAADRSPCLAALTNFASGSPDAAAFIIDSTKIAVIAYHSCRLGAPYATYAARLLANISRHFPDRVYEQLHALDSQFLSTILSKFFTTTPIYQDTSHG